MVQFEGVPSSEFEKTCIARGGLSKSGKTVIQSENVHEPLEEVLIKTWGYNAAHVDLEIIEPRKVFYFHAPGHNGGGFTGRMWSIVRGGGKTTVLWDLFRGQQAGTVPK